MATNLLIDDRAAWLKERSTYLGGTDVAVLLGKNPYKTPAQLFLEKTGQLQDSAGRKAEMGIALEPYLRRWVAEDLSLTIDQIQEPIRDPEHPFLAANVDGSIDLSHPITFGEWVLSGGGLWEGKTYDYKTAENWGEAWTDQVPIHYWVQAQWYTGITRRQWILITALDRGACDYTPFIVWHDPETFALMRKLAIDYWRNHIETGKMPPLGEGDADVVLAAYPKPVLPSAELTSEIEETCRELAEIYSDRKALNARWSKLTDALKVAIAPAHRLCTEWGEFAYQIRTSKTGDKSAALKTPFKD